VARVARAGVSVMAVTDHDTTAAVAECAAEAARRGMACIPGIEITAVDDEHDIHVLGYFLDTASRPLQEFLVAQRADRVARVEAIAARLGSMGLPIDVGPICARARRRPSTSVGRPQVASALVAAGHATSFADAFDRLIGRGRPAFVPRRAVPPADVVDLIAGAGGIASLAHPGLNRRDDLLAPLAGAGLAALEAFHTDHDEATTARYLAMASALGTAVSGGSDFHGDAAGRPCGLGRVVLPQAHFRHLVEVARERGCPVPQGVVQALARGVTDA
jgi:predicted metal-dependent phosphoesterase TrpH